MMMSLGQFVFSLDTAAYQQLQRSTQYRQAAASRVGALPARQFVGPGDDTITLSGAIMPPVTGKRESMHTMRQMAAQGEAWVLVDGTGNVHGAYVITQVDETQTLFFRDGTPRKIEFTLTLAHVDDAQVAENPSVSGPDIGSIDTGDTFAGVV